MADRHTSGLRSLQLATSYRTSRSDLLLDFYIPCLKMSSSYDRSVGYFRSTLFAVTAIAFSDFVQNGGQARTVCSPSLRPEDIEAIEAGERARESLSGLLSTEWRRILRDPLNKPYVVFLSALVASGALEIRIAKRPEKQGIFHDKVGIFGDDRGDFVTFEGSSNETWSAWSPDGNHEGFSVFASWEGEREEQRVQGHIEYFESLWTNNEPDIEVVPFPEAALDEIVSASEDQDVVSAAEQLIRESGLIRQPQQVGIRLPDALMPHQQDVLEDWEQHGRKGIVPHATGSGKTFTGLEAIRRWIIEDRPALVLVPTSILLSQWADEATRVLPMDFRLLKVGGETTSPEWGGLIAPMTSSNTSYGPRLTIASMASASSGRFRSRVKHGEHLLVVGDEVHRLGAATWSRSLEIESGGALGLSATPQRFGDPDGTQQILDYFGGLLEPPFTLADAIKAGRLVPYDYHIAPVDLEPDEVEEWLEQSRKIARAVAQFQSLEEDRLPESLKMLFIRRARILKKARQKIATAADLVASRYTPGDSWLVYCEDTEQLELVRQEIIKRGVEVDAYYSSMGNQAQIELEYFVRRGGVLAAIRCLDEGVDIPAVDHAVIVASSSNPRQFVQRRGRVLRKAPDKFRAEIHDVLVLPPRSTEGGEDTLPIVRSELARAALFAQDAANLTGEAQITNLRIDYGLMTEDTTRFSWEDEGEQQNG